MNRRYAACILSCHISDTLQVTVWQWEQGPAQIQLSGGDCGRCQLAPLPVTTCQMKSARSGPAATSLCTPLSPIVLTLEENVFNTEITIKNNKPVEVLLAFRAVLFVMKIASGFKITWQTPKVVFIQSGNVERKCWIFSAFQFSCCQILKQ